MAVDPSEIKCSVRMPADGQVVRFRLRGARSYRTGIYYREEGRFSDQGSHLTHHASRVTGWLPAELPEGTV